MEQRWLGWVGLRTASQRRGEERSGEERGGEGRRGGDERWREWQDLLLLHLVKDSFTLRASSLHQCSTGTAPTERIDDAASDVGLRRGAGVGILYSCMRNEKQSSEKGRQRKTMDKCSSRL